MSEARDADLRLPAAVRLAMLAAAGVLVALGVAYYFTYEPAPQIVVLWRDNLPPNRRSALERRFRLVDPEPHENRFTYDLLDTSQANIKALVNEPDVEDTDRIDQSHYLIPFETPYGGSWMWVAHRIPILRAPGVVPGIVLACIAVIMGGAGAWVEGRRLRKRIGRL
jgi:hypothetical protein